MWSNMHMLIVFVCIGRLSDEQEKLAKLEHLDGMAVQLLPVLERNFKICLSDSLFEKPKCNLGDIRCHEIDLREKTANCAMCVNGTLIPDTDDGPPDYCVHFVTIQKTTNINIIFEEYEVTFTYNGTILGRVPLNFGHSLEDNPKCNCTWALFNYTSFNNTPTISKLNDLLYCVQKNDECSSTDWLCFANSTGNVGRCYDHTATCQLQNGMIPICSLAILPQISVNIKQSCPSGGHGTIGMNCDFTWELESIEFLVNGNDMSFEINWDDKKIENLQCSGASEWTCFNTFCNDSNSTVYKYNFTTCQFVSIPAGKISEQPSVQPNSEDSGVGATAWLVVIIVLILIVFLAYVTYQNYEKVCYSL